MFVYEAYLPHSSSILQFCQSSFLYCQHYSILTAYSNLGRGAQQLEYHSTFIVFSRAYRSGAFLHSLLRVFYLEEVAIR